MPTTNEIIEAARQAGETDGLEIKLTPELQTAYDERPDTEQHLDLRCWIEAHDRGDTGRD